MLVFRRKTRTSGVTSYVLYQARQSRIDPKPDAYLGFIFRWNLIETI